MKNLSGINGSLLGSVEIISTSKFFSEKGKWYSNDEISESIYGLNWKNEFLKKNLDINYYKNEYGFEKRYFVRDPAKKLTGNEPTSADLMEGAANVLLKKTKIKKNEISLLIATSTTSHRYTTSLGAIVAGRLGLKCASFEIKSGCSSMIHAIIIASQFVNLNKGKVLILSGETLSKVASGIFNYVAGDGGGAILFGHNSNKKKGIQSYYLESNGKFSNSMGVPGILPPIGDSISNTDYFFKISKGNESFIKSKWKLIPKRLYELSKLKENSIKYLIPHQVNNNMIEIARKSAKLEKDQLINKVGDYGNCGQLSILLALHDTLEIDAMKNNENLMLCAVGGGLAWGGLIWKF